MALDSKLCNLEGLISATSLSLPIEIVLVQATFQAPGDFFGLAVRAQGPSTDVRIAKSWPASTSECSDLLRP